ncbi:hypothetical protein DFH94DRAFT_752746 [Russula ochroleuca]|uniref:Uncharacterized protein n=1 Tax=Russula ochroleuca TaxID=152965 RepID=A0A9P5T6C2_9AGAM|nr:hypothetical protein DFH94DRAFT_752746 [Russula ochroleuca]
MLYVNLPFNSLWRALVFKNPSFSLVFFSACALFNSVLSLRLHSPRLRLWSTVHVARVDSFVFSQTLVLRITV